MKAVILAGGVGTRLKPYTAVLPKPLMPVGDYPILEVVIRQLKAAGFREVILAVGHLAGLIEAYFGDGAKWGLRICYSREQEPLGTAGPLALIDELPQTFLVMNGDILTDLDYRDLMDFHERQGNLATIAMCHRDAPVTLGVLQVDEQDRITDYIEKPQLRYLVSMGVYAFDRRVIGFIERGRPLNFPELIQDLVARERVQGYPFSGRWLDIGRPEDYEVAIEEFAVHRRVYLPDG